MLDPTVKVFNQFYDLNVVVDSNQYDIVYSFFQNYTSDSDVAKNFTEALFKVSNETQINILTLLDTFKSQDAMKINLTMAYYLNSINKNKTTMYGVGNAVAPNNAVQCNILQSTAPPSPYPS